MATDTYTESDHKIDRLLDAIELVKEDCPDEALPILRGLIREDSDFEDAWLWMSVVAEDVDQSIICLDNVLRINPDNANAAIALYHLRQAEIAAEEKRARLRNYRDWSIISLWTLIMVILISALISFSNLMAMAEATA